MTSVNISIGSNHTPRISSFFNVSLMNSWIDFLRLFFFVTSTLLDLQQTKLKKHVGGRGGGGQVWDNKRIIFVSIRILPSYYLKWFMSTHKHQHFRSHFHVKSYPYRPPSCVSIMDMIGSSCTFYTSTSTWPAACITPQALGRTGKIFTIIIILMQGIGRTENIETEK